MFGLYDRKSAVPVSSDTLRPPPPPSPPPRTLESGTLDVDATAHLARGGTTQPPAPPQVQPAIMGAARPQIIQAEQPAIMRAAQPQMGQVEQPANDRPKKRRKRKHSLSGTHDGVVPQVSPAEAVDDPARMAGSSQSIPFPTVSPQTLLASNKSLREPAPPQQAPPPAAKKGKPAVRPSAPRPASDVNSPVEDGLFSAPTPPSHGTPTVTSATPHPQPRAPDPSSSSRATHEPSPASGPISGLASTDARPAALKAAATHPPAHAPIPSVIHVPLPTAIHVPLPTAIHAPAPPPVHALTSSPIHATAPSFVHAPTLPSYTPQEELEDAALNFLRQSVSVPLSPLTPASRGLTTFRPY